MWVSARQQSAGKCWINYPALVLIAATGIRKGEALALRWDHIDLDAATIRIDSTLARIGGQLVVPEAKTER